MSACHFSLRLALLGARATGPSKLQFGTLNHGRRAAINRGPVCPELPDNRTLHGHHKATRMTQLGPTGAFDSSPRTYDLFLRVSPRHARSRSRRFSAACSTSRLRPARRPGAAGGLASVDEAVDMDTA